VAHRAEWLQQVELCRLLDKWLPDDAFWTATDPVAPSPMSGAMRRRRGIKRGVPDILIWCRRTKPIAIEMKSPGGRCSASQRATRKALIAAGVKWFEARSACRSDDRDRGVPPEVSPDHPHRRHGGALEEAAISGLGKTAF